MPLWTHARWLVNKPLSFHYEPMRRLFTQRCNLFKVVHPNTPSTVQQDLGLYRGIRDGECTPRLLTKHPVLFITLALTKQVTGTPPHKPALMPMSLATDRSWSLVLEARPVEELRAAFNKKAIFVHLYFLKTKFEVGQYELAETVLVILCSWKSMHITFSCILITFLGGS